MIRKILILIFVLSCAALGQLAGMAGEKGVSPGVSLPSVTTTSPLPTGTQSTAYSYTMSATGGVLPYTWSVTSGALPTGLSLSSGGVISGTPSTAQTTTPTIQISDANAHTDSKAFSVTINASGAGCSGFAANRTISVGDPTQVPPSGSLLNVSGGAYCLNNDISCPDSCIAIQNNNISLDLNGHVVTYAATNALGGPRFGIYGIGCNEGDATTNNNSTATPCGGNWKSPTIFSSTACTMNGGTPNIPTSCAAQIVQGAGATGINDALRFGGTAPSSSCSGGTFHDFATTLTHPSNSQNTQKASASLHFRYCEGALSVYNVLSNNSTAWVANRTQFEGPDFRFENWTDNAGIAFEIKNSNVSGGGQGGIFPYQHYSANIHDNQVGTSGHVVQDFAISAYGTNDVVNNNVVNCASCRGIFISGHDFHLPASDNVLVHDNTVTVSMLPQYTPDGNITVPITNLALTANVITLNISNSSGSFVGSVGGPVTLSGLTTNAGLNGTTLTISTLTTSTLTAALTHANIGSAAETGNVTVTTTSWGCEPHGSYGIQFDDNATNSIAYNNTVVGTVQNGTAGDGSTQSCQFVGLKVTSNNTGDRSHDNSFSAKRATSGVTSKAIAFGTESNTAPVGFSSTDDTFNADSANFFVDWLGAQQAQTFTRPIIGAPASGGILDASYVTFYFGNGAGSNCNNPSVCPVHWVLIDPTFNGSASKDSHNMQSYGGSVGPAEYFIEWTYKPTILCAGGSGSCTPGNAVSGATVTITDNLAAQVFSGNTDASGHIASGAGTTLIEFRRSNCTTANFGNSCGSGGAVVKYANTPHSVAVTKAGCTTLNYALTITATTTENRNLTCP